MTSYEAVIQHPLDAEAVAMVGDLDATHKAVMRPFADLGGLAAESPRKALGVLFHLTLPGMPGHVGTGVAFHLRTTQIMDGFTPIPLLSVGDRITIEVRLAAERRQTERDVTGRRTTRETVRPIGDHEAEEWAIGLLTKAGLAVGPEGRLSISTGRNAGREKLRFAYRDLRADVVVVDADAANNAVTNGIGRGKNYGFGMLRTKPTSD